MSENEQKCKNEFENERKKRSNITNTSVKKGTIQASNNGVEKSNKKNRNRQKIQNEQKKVARAKPNTNKTTTTD
jgi:hypothetical protein